MKITYLHPRGRDLVGFIPQFLNESDPRSIQEQFNESYAHGGGWQPFGKDKWKVLEDKSIKYPGDPPYSPVAKINFRTETIYIYPDAWVMIEQADGSFEIARMD